MEHLLLYVNKYKKYYLQPIQNEFHCYCSLITSQRVRFQTGRNIRRKLYELCGYPLTIDAVQGMDLSSTGLTTQQREAIQALCDGVTLNEIKGIGKWTHKGVQILMQSDHNVNLYEDSYIRTRLSEYNGLKSSKECRDFIALADEETYVSYFLWRITPIGIIKVKDGQKLSRDDFI